MKKKKIDNEERLQNCVIQKILRHFIFIYEFHGLKLRFFSPKTEELNKRLLKVYWMKKLWRNRKINNEEKTKLWYLENIKYILSSFKNCMVQNWDFFSQNKRRINLGITEGKRRNYKERRKLTVMKNIKIVALKYWTFHLHLKVVWVKIVIFFSQNRKKLNNEITEGKRRNYEEKEN